MKTKSRNLLTVILALLCAIAVAIGVGFALPKAEKISAQASGQAGDITITSCTPYYGDSVNPITSLGQMQTTSPFNTSVNKTDTTITFMMASSSQTCKAVYYKFTVGVTVPAWEEWEISYNLDFTCRASCAVGGYNSSSGLYYFYPNPKQSAYDSTYNNSTFTDLSAMPISKDNDPTQDNSQYKCLGKFQTNPAYSYSTSIASGFGTSSNKIKLTNNSNNAKQFTFSYAAGFVGGCAGMNMINQLDVRLTSRTQESKELYVTAPEDVDLDYTGSDLRTAAQTLINATTWYKRTDANDSSSYYTHTAGEWASYTMPTNPVIDVIKNNGVLGGHDVTYALTDATNHPFKLADGTFTTDSQIFKIIVNPIKTSVPTVQNSTQTYKGAEYDNFTLTNYNPGIMSVASYTSNNGSTIIWDNTAGSEKFKATDAAEYTVNFHMDSDNYLWDVNGGTSADQSKTITINKKDITINTTPAANSNPSWNFGDTGSIAVNATASGISNPDFVLNVYYVLNTAPTTTISTGVSGTTLDVSQIASSGSYTLCVELTSAAANKNYSIANDKFTMPFEIKSGDIDFSVINWTCKEGTGNATPLFNGTQLAELRYKQDENGNSIKYFISANIPAGEYLSIDTSYNSGGFKDGFYTTLGGATYNDGCSAVGTYKTRVALVSDSDHLFKSTANSGSFGGDNTKGWYEIEWKIEKGKVDPDYLDNLNKYLQYRPAGGAWTTYDPDNPPQFGSGAIEIRLDPAKYAAGIDSAEVTVNNKQTAIGNYTATVKFTYNPNYENAGNKSFNWQIGAMVIDVDWTSDSWIKDGTTDPVVDDNNVPYQIRVLNIPDNLKQYVEYKYYIADPGDPSIKGTLIGTGDAGLQDLISAPYNASSTNAVYVYVEAVIKSGVTQYTLKDDTGNDYTNCMLFQLGATNTLVKVSLTETEMQYGENKLAIGIVSMHDTGMNGQLDQSTYVEGIYLYDPQGNNLGLLKDYDGTKAGAGVYTIKIVLNQAGEDTYTLSPGSTLKFTIKPKTIFVPTVAEITFNNQFVNFADYLGGSWNDYKDIIKLGGTVDGVKNVGSYTATLTLLDGNYCWDYSKGIKPARLSLASDEMICSGDETVATYEWKIKPYVLKASAWNLKGKDGAVYNIPAELTDGLDVDINYLYHPDKTSSPLGDGESLQAGSTYFVKAQLIGADRENFVFEDSKTTTSDFATYKLPQSGAAQAWNVIKGFMSKTWLGLPVWAWLLIALALIILLIVIIVVAVKRRKTKEEREEIKARKEEERLRKEEEKQRREEEREEERRRREEERRLQQEKLEAERELAKAKQEAELEKIRAQAQMAAGAGMATMAVQQQPAQQIPPQPVQQVQSVDNELLKEMRQQMAELRADNKATQAQLQAMQNSQNQAMPAPQPMQYPMYPQYQQMPMMPQYPQMPNYGGGNDMALARMEAQLNAMQAEQRARYDAEQRIELAAMRAEQHVDRDSRHSVDLAAMREHINGYNYNRIPDYSNQGYNNQQQPNSVEALGAIVAAALKNISAHAPAQPVAELPQQTEASTPAEVKYPSDAVITTTTTVDTTKNKPIRREEDDGRIFDSDGFYDTFE
ncbi:MAG: hypothetical protein K2N22_03020, partial [Clostridia bacterium]|nr:hypothetical protein [Clostridia bacterium]